MLSFKPSTLVQSSCTVQSSPSDLTLRAKKEAALNGIEEVSVQLKTSGNVSPLVIMEGSKWAVAKLAAKKSPSPESHFLFCTFWMLFFFFRAAAERNPAGTLERRSLNFAKVPDWCIQGEVKNGQISCSPCLCPNHLTI